MTELSAHKLYTIGYSTRGFEYFVSLLQIYGIERIIDIRTIPKSRFCPQFNTDILKSNLASIGIDYLHLKELGGLRHPVERFSEHGVEQRFLSRVCRLHANR